MLDQPVILVVDDQAVILEFIELLLSEDGYVVVTARNGREAVEQVVTRPPQMVVSDIAMPELNGWQLVQAIRAFPFGHTLPIILMSAARELPFRRAGLDQWTAFLAKPFTIDALLGLIARLLHR